jgi:hypothetical protein
MRSWPRQLARISINTGGQFSFWQVVSELQSNTCAHCSCPVSVQFWRRAAVAAAATSSYAWTISWLGFGLSDQLLLMRYLSGKVCYPLFGYLARVCFRSDSLSRLRCSEGGSGLWLGDKGIFNGKTSTSTYILTGYGPTPPSFSLNAGRKHSR